MCPKGKRVSGPQTESLGRGMGFSQAPAQVSEESRLPHSPNPAKPPGQLHITKNLLADSSRKSQPLPTRSALREPPQGRGRVSWRRPAPTPPFTHPDRPSARAGSLPSHEVQKAAGVWLCSPRPHCAVGVGGGEEKGALLQPDAEGDRPGSWAEGIPPEFLEETGAGLYSRQEGEWARLRRKGAPGPRRGGKCSGEEGRGCSELKGRR